VTPARDTLHGRMSSVPATIEAPRRSPAQGADGGDAADARVHDDARSAGIDGVRGIAALTVFCFHVWLYGRLFTPSTEPVDTAAKVAFQFRLGLICFFVLTGYLLYRSFTRAARQQKGPVDWRLYVQRRAARILPAYYVSIFLTFLFLNGAEGKVPGVKIPDYGDLWLFAVLGQNYHKATILSLNPVTWTLVVEMAFYIALPFIGLFAYYVARGRRRPQVLFCLGMIAAGVLWHWWVYASELNQQWSKSLGHYLPYFALGMLTSLWLDWRDERGIRRFTTAQTTVVTLLALAFIGGAGYWHATSPAPQLDATVAIVHDIPGAIGFALLIAVAAAGTGPSIAWIRVKPLASLGLVSYGFYLWHVPLILTLHRIGVGATHFPELFAIAFPVTLAFATASWLLIEKPLIARYHRRKLVEPEQAAP
jgi:peptidoglycan/LPS O-acetylase OafA/YrhL